MLYLIRGRSLAFTFAAIFLIGCLIQATGSSLPAEQPVAIEVQDMTPTKKAEALGVKFEKLKPAYLNWCARSGKMLYTSGFSSKMKGRLGKDLTTKQGYEAAKECAHDILRAVWDRHGTLDNLRVVKVLGCVHATPDFTEH